MARRTGNALSVILAVAFAVVSVGAQAESHVRIIRLSYIDGSVQMDRATGQGLERAILNTPVTEGVLLVTGNDGLAEVEFENNSTVRVGENSEVRFSKLVVNDAGAKVNEVELVKGTVYFDTKSSKDDIYRADVGNTAFLVHRDTQLRLSDDSGEPKLSVLKGEVELESQSHGVKVGKKETLTVDDNSAAGYEIAKGVDDAPLDRWNDERSAYQTAYSYNNTGVGPNLNAFGYSDLSYYGGWSYVNGIGYGWQPYGVDSWVGWNPYLAGAWSFAPGLGYSWASAYPWGWLPYHYGSWSYVGGSGWFWLPGSGNTYRNSGWYTNGFLTAPVVNGPPGWQPPKAPPLAGGLAYAPTVKVGTIGNLPAVIPGGRVPPDFRSVVPKSSFMDRAASVPGHTVPVFATAQGSSAIAHTGHVFATPPRATASEPGYGWGAGSMGSVGSPHAAGAAGASHAIGAGAAGHGSGHGSPK